MNGRWNKYYREEGKGMVSTKTDTRRGGLPSLGLSGNAPLIQWHLSRNWNKWQAHAGCLEERHPEEWKIRYKGTANNSLERLKSLSDPSHRYRLCIQTFSCKSRTMIVYFIQKTVENMLPNLAYQRHELQWILWSFECVWSYTHTQYVSHLATISFCLHPRARHSTRC